MMNLTRKKDQFNKQLLNFNRPNKLLLVKLIIELISKKIPQNK